MLRIVSLALVFLALCRGQNQPPANKGSIEGQVTTSAGDPLPSATVRMILVGAAGPSEQNSWTTQSDSKGKFVFERLEPRRYSILTEHSGFVRSSAAVVSLSAGQSQTGVVLKMIPEARISGKVVDQDRNPVPKPQLSLFRKVYTGESFRLTRPIGMGMVETTDEGTFSVSGLAAGRYYLFVISPEVGQRPGPDESYVNTYYPDATDASRALPIQVAAGVDVNGIEIHMRKERVIHIRGTVKDLSGAAPADDNRALMLYPRGVVGGTQMLRSAALRNGEFEFDRISPGAYHLVAHIGSLAGAEDIIVGKNHIDDMLVRVQPGGEIAGKVIVDGDRQSGQPAYPTSIAIDGTIQNGTDGIVAKDGTFVHRDLAAGAYHLFLSGIPAGQYTKSFRSGELDLTTNPLVLGPGGRASIEVVMSPNAAHVNGVMRDSDGATLQGVTVSAWSDHFYVSAVTGYDGTFNFASLPPGDYRLLAWEKIDDGVESVAGFRSKFDADALKIKLDEKAQVNLVVPLIPRDAIEREEAKLP